MSGTMIDPIASVLLIAAGLAALCYGGSWLVRGGVQVASRLGLSPLVIGITVVAYGTSAPELAASIAAGGEHGAIILGNIVGSNIANIGMVAGVAAVLAPLAVSRRALSREIPMMIGFSVLLVALSLDGELSWPDGVLLIASLGAFTAYVCGAARAQDSEAKEMASESSASMSRAGATILAGIVALYAGSVIAIDSAVSLASSLGVPERVIGITIVAVGTSLPELVTSVIAIRKGHAGIGIGNIIGSNVCNVLLVAGTSAALFSVGVGGRAFADYAVMIGFSIALFAALGSGKIGRRAGAALVGAYAVYLAGVALY